MKHMVLVHKTDGTSVDVVKAQVQEKDNEKKGAKEIPNGPAVKNKALSFFAPLANIFNGYRQKLKQHGQQRWFIVSVNIQF